MQHLEQRLSEYLKRHNENPRPLVWTKSLGEIIDEGRTRSGGAGPHLLIIIFSISVQ